MKTNKVKTFSGKKLHFDALKVLLSDHLKKNPNQAFTARQLVKIAKSGNNKTEVEEVLERLVQTKRITVSRNGQFQYSGGKSNTSGRSASRSKDQFQVEGRIAIIRSGAAYLISDQSAQDVYIPAKFLKGAIQGDIVRVLVNDNRRGKPEGKVTDIVRRETHFFVGTIQLRKATHLVYPDGEHQHLEIHVKNIDSMGAKDGDKVVVKILAWRDESHRFPSGVVTQILDKGSVIDNEMMAILINNGFPLEFSKEATELAIQVASNMQDGLDWPDRKDFRHKTTFTIDPLTAKDFDDALSFTRLENGHLEIGVHIADASHYLQEGTILDQEAYARSTSVYLVDRALPMLPDVLSGDICSLKPNCDRLTFSVVFVIDPAKSTILHTGIGKSIIHSNHRFTYEDAQIILDNKQGLYFDELNDLNKLAIDIRKKRFASGSIGFESAEYRFELDPITGKPLSVKEKTRIDTHLLIEEFMLLANKAVAEFIHKKEKNQDTIPFIYRVHDLPDLEKLADLAAFAKEFGYEIKLNTPKEIAHSLNALYEATVQNEALKLLQPLAIRTMAKAEYTSNNIGHYGLAFELYSHFTSPIRRYSDIIAHRILFKNLNQIFRTDKKQLEEQCKHISNQERKAMEAERESVKFFQLLYIADQVGQSFNGKVAGLIERGIFVELDENHVEGFIPFEDMNDQFILSNNRLKVMARRSGLTIAMGDRIKVKIEAADMKLRRVQMSYISKA